MDKKLTGKTGGNASADDSGYVLFEDRLHQMQANLISRAAEVCIEYEGNRSADTIEHMSNHYRQLAHFTGLLAASARDNQAELTGTHASLGRLSALNPALRASIANGMERHLIYEIKDMRGNFHDGEPNDFAIQVKSYVDKLRSEYHIRDPEKPEQRLR